MDDLAKCLGLKYVVQKELHPWNVAQVRLHLAFIIKSWVYSDFGIKLLIWIQPRQI